MTVNRWTFACLTLGAAALAACGSDDGTTPSRPAANVNGIWDFTEILVDQSVGLTCNDTGSYVFAQTDDAFSGTSGQVGTCTQGGNAFSNNSDQDAVTSGSVSDTTLTFNVGGCVYRGEAAGDPPSQITGTATCGLTLTGTWQAVPGAPVATVAITPPASSVLVGGRVRLVAVARSGTGRRLFGRAVTWASDNLTAAVVGTTGLVTGQAAGTANITAAVQSITATLALTVRVVTFTTLSAGLIHTCGRVGDGSVYCWGDHSVGQLGSATAPDICNGFPCNNTAQSVIGGPPLPPGFAALAVGGGHACGLDPAGAAFCWGWNVSGQLGSAPAATTCAGDPCATQPIAVSGGLAFARLSGGFAHSCGLTAAAAYCWGENFNGQLGSGSTSSSTAPVAVGGGLSFDSLSAGAFHTCALTAAGAAYCWGYNEAGQVGDGNTADRTAPQAVIGGLTFATVSAGRFHSCGVTPAGAAYCWGLNGNGQLGATSASTCSNVPCSLTAIAVSGGLTFASVTAGGFHTCGLTTGGVAYCWGTNSEGELGNGTQVPSPTPVAVSGGLAFARLTTGQNHSCGVTTGGVAYCWGLNVFGQLGNGSVTGSLTPAKVLGQP